MFDLRYHVASLAAVFLALIIGILVGVGIASQTTVSERDRIILERRQSGIGIDSRHASAPRRASYLRCSSVVNSIAPMS